MLLMRYTYQLADTVIVWIGPEGKLVSMAIDLLEQLNQNWEVK